MKYNNFYKGIDPNDTEAIKKRNIARRRKQEKTMRAKQRNYAAQHNYSKKEKDDNLRASLFQGISGMIAPGIERLFKANPVLPTITDNPDTSLILHEFEKIRLYLFNFVTELANIKEQIIRVNWEIYRLNHPEEYTHTPPSPPPTYDDWIKPQEYTHTPPQPPNPFDRNSIYKGPNKNKGQDFVRKNIAQILKNMIPQHYMDQMPKEVKDAYINILGVMAPPNDPIWDKDQGQKKEDPREPWSFDDVAKYWNNIAEGTKKLDGLGADWVGEVVKGANEMLKNEEPEANAFGLDDDEPIKAEKKKDDDEEPKEEL